MTVTNREKTMRTESEVPMLRLTAAARLAGAVLLVALTAACGDRSPAPRGTQESHAALSTGLACTGAGAHVTHLNTFACDVCHEANGGRFLFTKVFTFPKGTSTQGGVITRGSGTTPTSCTVACHYPMGSAQRTVTWNTPGPLACTACHDTGVLPASHPTMAANAPRSDCTACHTMSGHLDGVAQVTGHPATWADRASPGFHAFSANAGLTSCQGCHGKTLAGQGATPGCGSCHDQKLPAGVASWDKNCVMCHGGTDDQSGAPPKATWGNSGDALRVGAHTAHAKGGALAPTYDCGLCHVKPAGAFDPGHLGTGRAEVVFSGIAARGASPTWDATSGTCSNIYCHGASTAGGTNKTPSWTGGTAEAACGSCHGVPPLSPHPAASGLASCATCHPDTVAVDGTVIPPAQGGKHLDGVLQAAGGHPATWMDQTSSGFHAYAANASITSCQSCHGVALDGVGGSATTACATCHGAGWKTSCTMCHGGTNDATGAPPKTTWGHPVTRAGAHARHLAGSANAPAVACATCHTVPTDALSAGHANGDVADVTFTGVAAAGNASPRWNAGTGGCATTYCHGGYSGTYNYSVYDWGLGASVPASVSYAGSGATPSWTGGAMTCASCHGAPPATGEWHSASHGTAGMSACTLCHPGVNAGGTGFTDPSRHLDGKVDVTPQYESRCFNCH